MAKSASAEDYRLRGSIEALRASLVDERFAERRDRPLAFWALPADRRLPLALLGCSLREVLEMPYDRLAGTPGIGQKKLRTLAMLLERAAEDRPIEPPVVNEPLPAEDVVSAIVIGKLDEKFDPAMVSESHWSEWTETIRRHGLGQVKLGRLSPSLEEIPTVIWNTPLSTFFDRTVAEIRLWRTYGEKRVRVILEVFYTAHRMLAQSHHHSQLAVRLLPKFIPPVEEWIAETMVRPGAPDNHEVRQSLAMPLLNQLSVDVGPTVQSLAEGRLGIEAPPQSVMAQARKMSVTRARVYQLLETCSKVMDVRWPEGRLALNHLHEKFVKQGLVADDLRLFNAVRDLFFPVRVEETNGETNAEAKPST